MTESDQRHGVGDPHVGQRGDRVPGDGRDESGVDGLQQHAKLGCMSPTMVRAMCRCWISVARSPSLITNVAVGANPRGIAFATVNGQPRVYVTRYSSSSVAVIDANTNTQLDVKPSTKTVDSIGVGLNPQSITVSADGTRAYVTNYGSSSVSVINTGDRYA